MSMIEWVRNENKSSLVLFVHGLKGGMETWSHDDTTSFPQLIKAEAQLQDGFDIACFNYFTTFTTTYGASKSLFAKMFGSIKALRKNLEISELGELLKTEFDIHLTQYKKIIVVAHSLGGLVSKSCILKQLAETEGSPVTGFISLAVPHAGAKIANIGSLITSNVQLKDLSILSDAVDQMTRDWIKVANTPATKYIYGAHDLFVDKKSALAIDSQKKDSIAVDEDHFSICKPKNGDQTVCRAVIKYILEFASLAKEPLKIKKFIDERQYNEHFFVLKMILADVHEVITGHAKGYFYNAEEARKIFTSEDDRELLSTLYNRIENIYRQEYEHHVANNTSSDVFVQKVHKVIFDEKDDYLKSTLSQLEDEHKKGMLHQLADKENTDIVWSSETTLPKLLALIESK